MNRRKNYDFANNGVVNVNGDRTTIIAEFGTICKALMEKGVEKDEILHAIDVATMSDEELKKEVEKAKQEVNKLFEEMFNGLFGN